MGDEEAQEPLEVSAIRATEAVIVEEATDALNMIAVDRQRLRVVFQRLAVTTLSSSPLQQFGIGFGVGWLSGYLFRKVSRTAAFVLGCGFLALQGATALGIISVNWRRLQDVTAQNIRRMSEASSLALSSSDSVPLSQQLMDLAGRHVYLSGGFFSGAVIAFSF